MELIFTHSEAMEVTASFKHLKNASFTERKTNHTYTVLSIMPVPANNEEMEELRGLLTEMIEKRGSNMAAIKAFESRERPDNFNVALFGTSLLSTGVNFLTILVRQYAAEDGSLKYGFRVDDSLTLF